jgi:hypothetical protein
MGSLYYRIASNRGRGLEVSGVMIREPRATDNTHEQKQLDRYLSALWLARRACDEMTGSWLTEAAVRET